MNILITYLPGHWDFSKGMFYLIPSQCKTINSVFIYPVELDVNIPEVQEFLPTQQG